MTWPIRFCANCGARATCRDNDEQCTCPGCGSTHYNDPRVCAGAVVYRHGRLLLVKRRMPPHPGTWDICGGYVAVGEHPRNAACREVLEETGLAVQMGPLIDIVLDAVGSSPALSVINIYYLAKAADDRLRPSDEVAEASWFSADSLPAALTFVTQRDVLDRACAMAQAAGFVTNG